MTGIAVLGYGIVGSGVVEIIEKNGGSIGKRAGDAIKVLKILDIRDFPGSPFNDIITKNSEEVFENDKISIIVETIGGIGIAYDFTKRALKSGKSVVTSNKELVATHGPELLEMANNNKCMYLFEASVGGGIPIIRPLNNCLAANEIDGIMGILNGTTNYILSKMKNDDSDFNDALSEAQEKGYAEADPTADIEGHDACRKIAILSSIAYQQYVDYREIYTEGITKITKEDMKYAEEMGYVIKLIARSTYNEDGIFACVTPLLIDKSESLGMVEGVFNAVEVYGDSVGNAMFYGQGAGKLPTASAVVADIIDIVKSGENKRNSLWVKNGLSVNNIDEVKTRLFIRVEFRKEAESQNLIKKIFGISEFIKLDDEKYENEYAFITKEENEGLLKQKIESITGIASIKEVKNKIRLK
jgi:homoserine dehydrogenase